MACACAVLSDRSSFEERLLTEEEEELLEGAALRCVPVQRRALSLPRVVFCFVLRSRPPFSVAPLAAVSVMSN